MKVKLSLWSAAIGALLLLLALNLLGVVHVDAWGIFGLAVTIACVWAIDKIFFSRRKSH